MHNNSSLNNAKIAVLIVAAGRGVRAGTDMPKQYTAVNGQTMLARTISCFDVGHPVMVVIHPDDEQLFEAATANLSHTINHVFGGATRTASVKAGLTALKDDSPDLVLIHDAARPFLSAVLIDRLLQTLTTHQAALPVLPLIDALKTNTGGTVSHDGYCRAQTPQGFRYADIYAAYRSLPACDSFADDIEIAQKSGLTIGVCQGDEANVKLTHPLDFKRLTTMINITAMGYDVHQICSGESVFLCGVEINAGFSLKGHSDADVGLHALTDALLGSISAGDIGQHFPPDDPKWKNAASDQFLSHAKGLVAAKGGIIDHVDITLICEQPKITPHRAAMRQRIADILDIPPARVSVKATTTEGLGFSGRGEGIAAQALANIRVPDAG